VEFSFHVMKGLAESFLVLLEGTFILVSLSDMVVDCGFVVVDLGQLQLHDPGAQKLPLQFVVRLQPRSLVDFQHLKQVGHQVRLHVLGQVLHRNTLETVVGLRIILCRVVVTARAKQLISVVTRDLRPLLSCVARGESFLDPAFGSLLEVVLPGIFVLPLQISDRNGIFGTKG